MLPGPAPSISIRTGPENPPPDGVRQVESRVVIERPAPVLADTLANLHAVLVSLAHHLARVEGRAGRRIGGRVPEGAEAGLDAGASGLLETPVRGERGRIALHVVPSQAAEQFVHWNAEGLTLDVPEGEVDRAQGV